MKNKLKIRRIKPADHPLLADFLYHAIFLPPGMEPLPRTVLEKPEIAIYIDGFGGGKGDCGFVAEQDGNIVGMAWTRVIPAFGHVDDDTPELAVSVLPEYRSKGIGTKLLGALFASLAGKGYKQTSLSVQKENPALRFYQRLGYTIIRENDGDLIMVRNLSRETRGIRLSLGISFGSAIGLLVGSIIGNIWIWMLIGACVGIIICSAWSAAERRG